MKLAVDRRSGKKAFTFLVFSLIAATTEADIFRWDNGQVIPGTKGITPGPGTVLADWDTDGHNLRYANFTDSNLSGSTFGSSWLDNADFSQANVSGALFFRRERDPSNFYPFATIARGANLTNANFSGSNLANASLNATTLTGANLRGANLSGARLYASILTNANLTGAMVVGAGFSSSSLTEDQLYSTASYQVRNLQGIALQGFDLSGWNLSGQILANANLSSAELTNTNLAGADLRNAQQANLSGAITDNTIWENGTIRRLNLHAGQQLVIRDYDGDPAQDQPPLAIVVQAGGMSIENGGILTMLFDADTWDSTIFFERSRPTVALGGTLELSFAPDVDVSRQVGRTFDLFDWTAVEPVGAFSVASPYLWDLSNLYSTGEVRLTGTGGVADYDQSGLVDQGDLDLVLLNWGSELIDPAAAGWTNDLPSGLVDQDELDKVLLNWGSQAGAGLPAASVSEPTTAAALLIILACLGARLRIQPARCAAAG